MTKNHLTAFALMFLTMPAAAETVGAKSPQRTVGPSGLFPRQDGKSIYEGVCQGCHMPGGKGAVGAGMYPALAGNPRLEEAGYPVAIIVHGQKAMPPMGPYFNDTQIANVVNYIRTNFGNRYTSKVTAAEVKGMR